jgi:hypothetical protein
MEWESCAVRIVLTPRGLCSRSYVSTFTLHIESIRAERNERIEAAQTMIGEHEK